MRPTPRRRNGEDKQPQGQVLVIFVLFVMFVLLTSAALVLDYGSWLTARRDYQAVADAAALSGAHWLVLPDKAYCASPDTCARRSAWDYLDTHLGLGLNTATLTSYSSGDSPAGGQAVGTTGFTAWVATPPNGGGTYSTGIYPGSLGPASDVLFVRVLKPQGTYFGAFGVGGTNVSAWATAGTFPSRFAVITLRRGTGNTTIDAGPSNTTDIKLAGTVGGGSGTTTLTVIDGDVGGNWGMKLNASSLLTMAYTAGGAQPSVWLKDYISCGNSCWSNSQVLDNSGASLSTTYPPNGARHLPGFIQDPNYPPPADLAANAPASATTSIPTGDGGGNVTINAGTVVTDASGDPVTCAATSPHLGPGWYDTINVKNNGCLILDPVNHHSDPNNPSLDIATPVGQGQLPGVYYVTCELNVSQGLVVGDGVTVIVRPSTGGGSCNNQFSPGSGSIVDLNRGCVTPGSCTGGQILGAWTTKGASSYAWNGTAWVYQSARESDPKTFGRGIAIYVLKPSQELTSPPVDANTSVIQVNSGAGLAWNGVTYAPHDNAMIAGQPNHAGVGQLIAWTFTFNGGTDVTQTYDGPDEGLPLLLEPCVSGTEGAC